MSISDEEQQKLRNGAVIRLKGFDATEINKYLRSKCVVDESATEVIGVVSTGNGWVKFRCINSSHPNLWSRGKYYVMSEWRYLEVLKGSEANRWKLLDGV